MPSKAQVGSYEEEVDPLGPLELHHQVLMCNFRQGPKYALDLLILASFPVSPQLEPPFCPK